MRNKFCWALVGLMLAMSLTGCSGKSGKDKKAGASTTASAKPKPPKTLEQLFDYPDGPSDMTPKEWSDFKRTFHKQGMLGYEVTPEGIYKFRKDPREYLPLYNAAKDVSRP